MGIKRRLGKLLAGTVVGTSILISAPAFSDEAQLQQQINAMQQQLNTLQAQLAQIKKPATEAGQQATKAQQQANVAQQQASASQQAVPYIPPNIYAADVPSPDQRTTLMVRQHPHLDGRHVHRDGRRVAAAQQDSSGASDLTFSTIPLLNSPLYNENELRFSAQQSRIAFKASGDIDPARPASGYYEMDFLGGAPTGNSRESNSYNPRIRQLWFSYDDDYWHGHFSAGQMWSRSPKTRVRPS